MGGIIEEVEVFPRWFKYLATAMLALAAVVLGYILVLRAVRRRLEFLVRNRTAEIDKERGKLKMLFDGSNDGLVLLEIPSLKIVDCNNSILRMAGYAKKEDIIGKTPMDLAPPKQPGGRTTAEVARSLQFEVLKKGAASSEWTLKRADGGTVYTEISPTPFEMEGKAVVQAALRDITARRLAEEKVHSLEELKSRFITALTHVTRMPLNRIRWALESLATGEFGQITSEGAALISQAISSDYAVLHLIDNMNMVLDIERGPLVLNKMPISLRSIVLSVKKDFESTAGCEGVKCEVIAPKTRLPVVDLDAEKIRRAIECIFDNAKRYMTRDKKEVRIELMERDGRVRCSVSDTGIGIPEAEQSYIFSRFYRASNAATAYPDGVGVGLYIAKAIVEAHGGTIGFESKEGEGSTFWMEFPAAGGQAPTSGSA